MAVEGQVKSKFVKEWVEPIYDASGNISTYKKLALFEFTDTDTALDRSAKVVKPA